ncbi:type 2 isopentenyl-diphosphate Delta-isomerase [Lacticaseibacillus hulanensis]|uniref:type 2 isopentenyl-diphosphate Delta-isomerase n=1 Tax=Lacticaseibacillus hulanensis TaxID=2493111 RepID=UPI000FDC60CD|nr:type 2 isopentenyl-diphosphate Delta-isomerase [Lacticaseibacillus hulanensis]
MTKQSVASHRKDEHYFLAEKFYQEDSNSDLDDVRFIRSALPESSVAAVDMAPGIADWQFPLLINAMTGGSTTTGKINAQLARIARNLHLPLASGSASVALKEPAVRDSFTVIRQENPDGFVLANIGADKTPADAQFVIKLLGANMLQVHLNAVQEMVMPEGAREFDWRDNLAAIIAASPVPVIVKEVGFGMRHDDFAAIEATGAAAIDVGGRGGTNFAKIENARRHDADYSDLFGFGQTTAESLIEAQGCTLPLIATGGIRTPLQAVAALRLGASAVGLAGLVLHWLTKTDEATTQARLQAFMKEMRDIVALLGCTNLAQLRQVPIVTDHLAHYAAQRGLTVPNAGL